MNLRATIRISSCTLAAFLSLLSSGPTSRAQEDQQLDQQLQAIAAAHHGALAVYAHNLRTGQTASLSPDLPVKTASTIKLGILLDAAEQIRAGRGTLDEKLVLNRENQVDGSGVLAQLTPPLALTLGDTLTLMVIVSDNSATNMAIDRLGLAHIDATLRAAGLKQTWLYKKVMLAPNGPMPADQAQFGLGKTTPREIASIMERLATCNLALEGQKTQSASPQVDGPLCGKLLHMLRNQHERDSLPRFIENQDTSEHGPAVANKAGALNDVRNDVALISTRDGPVVIAAFTFDNADQRWNSDNEGELTLAKVGKAVIDRWSPQGLDPEAFSWDDPLKPSRPTDQTTDH
jgi:beta-lactamase class A